MKNHLTTIEYGHIFTYYIKRPGTYTQEELISWKQLKSYNYFESGYVRTVHSQVFGSGGGRFVVLKVFVNPSQKSSKISAILYAGHQKAYI